MNLPKFFLKVSRKISFTLAPKHFKRAFIQISLTRSEIVRKTSSMSVIQTCPPLRQLCHQVENFMEKIMSKVAFMTIGLLKAPRGDEQVQGFFDRSPAIISGAEVSPGFIARSFYDERTCGSKSESAVRTPAGWQASWLLRPACRFVTSDSPA